MTPAKVFKHPASSDERWTFHWVFRGRGHHPAVGVVTRCWLWIHPSWRIFVISLLEKQKNTVEVIYSLAFSLAPPPLVSPLSFPAPRPHHL